MLTASASHSSENHDFQILELEERLDGYQRDAVIEAIPDEIIGLFEMYFTESHFPSFPIITARDFFCISTFSIHATSLKIYNLKSIYKFVPQMNITSSKQSTLIFPGSIFFY